MSSERENANGPTQVHPALNFNNDLTQHIHLNGLNGMNNGINGIIGGSKPFAERGELSTEFPRFSDDFRDFSYPKMKNFEISRDEQKFSRKAQDGACAIFRGIFNFLLFYLVGLTISGSVNGSKVTVTRRTARKFMSRICLAMAATMPPDRENRPLK
jgi:hypothetical protein